MWVIHLLLLQRFSLISCLGKSYLSGNATELDKVCWHGTRKRSANFRSIRQTKEGHFVESSISPPVPSPDLRLSFQLRWTTERSFASFDCFYTTFPWIPLCSPGAQDEHHRRRPSASNDRSFRHCLLPLPPHPPPARTLTHAATVSSRPVTSAFSKCGAPRPPSSRRRSTPDLIASNGISWNEENPRIAHHLKVMPNTIFEDFLCLSVSSKDTSRDPARTM